MFKTATKEQQPGAKKTNATSFLLRPVVQIGLLLFVGFGIYLPSLHAPFLLDDYSCITKNPAIFSFDYFFDFEKVRALNIPYDIKNNFLLRTVPYFTFALNYYFDGLNEFGYHLVNISIHLLNGVLVYLLITVTLRRAPLPAADTAALSATNFIPALVALLFVVHPLQTQAVSHINQRFTSLVATFFFAALLLYIAARLEQKPLRQWIYYGSALLMAIAAMKTKETAFPLPVILFLYDLFFLAGRFRQRLSRLTPFFLTMAIIPGTIFWRLTNKGIADPERLLDKSFNLVNSNDIGPWEYLRTQFSVIVDYLRLLILPIDQNLIHDYPLVHNFFTLKTIASFFLILAILGAAVWLAFRSFHGKGQPTDRLISFGIFWFFITIAMSSSIIPLDIMMLEYRVYLPSCGFFLPLVVMAATVADKRPLPYRIFLAASTITILSLSAATVARNDLYADKERLLLDIIAKSPKRLEAKESLAAHYLDSQRYDEAIASYTEILQSTPDDANMNLNLAFALHDKGRIDDAIKQYQMIISRSPDNQLAHASLAYAFLEKGQFQAAESAFRIALELDPGFVTARYSLSRLYEQQSRIGEAIDQYRLLLKSHPDYFDVPSRLKKLTAPD